MRAPYSATSPGGPQLHTVRVRVVVRVPNTQNDSLSCVLATVKGYRESDRMRVRVSVAAGSAAFASAPNTLVGAQCPPSLSGAMVAYSLSHRISSLLARCQPAITPYTHPVFPCKLPVMRQ